MYIVIILLVIIVIIKLIGLFSPKAMELKEPNYGTWSERYIKILGLEQQNLNLREQLKDYELREYRLCPTCHDKKIIYGNCCPYCKCEGRIPFKKEYCFTVSEFINNEKIKADIDSVIRSLKILDEKVERTHLNTTIINFINIFEHLERIEKLLTKK